MSTQDLHPPAWRNANAVRLESFHDEAEALKALGLEE